MVGIVDNVSRWERSLDDFQNDLDKCRAVEEKQMKEIDDIMRSISDIKNRMISEKHQLMEQDEDINKVTPNMHVLH